jgi:hypothetical protein
MAPDQYPKKQDISFLPRTFDLTINMLSAANNLLFELERIRDTPENLNQLPILIFDKFIQLLPSLNSHCEEWRLDDLTEDQLEQVEGIEWRLEEIEKCCLQSRVIMDYLLLETIPTKTPPTN